MESLFLQIILNEFKKLWETFQNNSMLKFTYKQVINYRTHFLDILIDANNGNFYTSAYKKTHVHKFMSSRL